MVVNDTSMKSPDIRDFESVSTHWAWHPYKDGHALETKKAPLSET